MNKERILEIADLIEAGHKGMVFDMSTYGHRHPCGTAACIAGWTVARFDTTGQATRIDHRRPLVADNVLGWARDALGLEHERACDLFIPTGYEHGVGVFDITASHAVRALRHLAVTGEVDWFATMEEN